MKKYVLQDGRYCISTTENTAILKFGVPFVFTTDIKNADVYVGIKVARSYKRYVKNIIII